MKGVDKMKLTITDSALDQLRKAFSGDQKLLLSLDDGVGPFSKVGVCSLDTSYDVIAVDKDAKVPDYESRLTTNAGDWYYKGYSKRYLDDDMKLDYTNNRFKLSGDGGILDGNVDLKDLTTQKTAK
ncbi:hypothetical protein HMPREF9104_00189 [Lentilactobacillus kisonensis F0435]|nr:hypothetical protein HMPREF9104_00189 [Lentilactobacillus kisonensis F0435]